MTSNATNPASSGPAGSHFEGQVGAHYLLSMLTGAEPRGLPGTELDRLEFQRAAEGHPLDDVILHAHDALGDPAVLEVQVKRSITFAPGDEVFRAVVGQIVKASRRPDFWNSRYELAIAIARTSRKIEGAYQDVLTWARQLGDPATFIARIDRTGSANPDMRTFVRTFKAHLHDVESRDDDETVWRLLRKLQILVFDFSARGSASEELAKERAVRALRPEDAPQAGNLWTTLVELAIRVAASGGDRTRDVLIEDLRSQSFQLAGDRRYSSTRAILAEASRNALADISDRIGDVMLTRHERVAEVHSALDTGRYVEIRGDAGVGKSGVLKHFAEQVATQARIIVLSPGRTTPKGWTTMRAVLGFDGTAHDLLTDLAGDGGVALFLDNLDFFDEDERRTVVDLVREAATVPGFAVIATARRNFGVEEPNWLPSDALDRLGRTDPVAIEELSDAEVDELRHAAPRLSGLLADTHPAREVTRNLFRLARLAGRPGAEPVPRTEVDMAAQWWQTADGRTENSRERARVLRALAEQALSRAESLQVSNHPAGAVDALVASETLRDLGNDRVAFHHDVLREWAIANLLHSEPTTIEQLSFDRPASAALARGVELASRMSLERTADSILWQAFVKRLTRDGTHGSWRRAALLGLVHSEISSEVMTRTSEFLLADRTAALGELIRIVMAVDVQPASPVFLAAGLDPAMIPASLVIPGGPSWYRLICWLLSLGGSLPVTAIPDVVALYTAWSLAMFGLDPLTPLLLEWLYRWLSEIESARDSEDFRDRREPFGGEFSYDRTRSLEDDLRTGFLMFCNRTPSLAAEYLRSVRQRRHSDEAVGSILKFRGTLAQAAPAALAELTAVALIPAKEHADRPSSRRDFEQPFDFRDRDFIPASPSQGPFFELLTYAPEHGLALVRRLVDHAIAFYSHGRHNSNAIVLRPVDVDRAFPWVRTYNWSRDASTSFCVASALMALEAWGHKQIEAGEPFDRILSKVLCDWDAPAAYVLVAVDLILSHWPNSLEAAIPFLACPELLCIDRQRLAYDNFEYPDFLGLKQLEKEPPGPVTLDSLKKRPSRRVSLEQLIGQYALLAPAEMRERLTNLLRQSSERLGPPDEQSDLGDPRFMASYALNLLDPRNWREVPATLPDGTQGTAYEYVPPAAETRHLTPLQEAARKRHADTNMQLAVGAALENPARSSSQFADAAVDWAQSVAIAANEEGVDAGEDRTREHAIVAAATIAMRDEDAESRARHEAWARGVFVRAFGTQEDSVYRFRSGLRFNPIATAFVGMIHLLKDCATTDDVRALLEAATRRDAAAAHGFGVSVTVLASLDERLPRAVLRCAFASCIRPGRRWELSVEEMAALSERHRQTVQAAVDAELAWLATERPEPDWPTFPSEVVRPRQGLSLSGGREPESPAPKNSVREEYADHQAAALWLSQASSFLDVAERPWLREIARAYATWTGQANGAGLDLHEELSNPPREWNDAYFDLLAHSLPGLTLPEVELLVLAPISSLPDEAFFDATTKFLRTVDEVYFNSAGLQETLAVSIRSALTKRLMASRGWKWLGRSRSASIETHIGPAIAALFFNDYGLLQPAKCYLLPKGVDRVDPFLVVLQQLAQGGPSLFVAVVTLNLLEVSARAAHVPFLVAAAKTWLEGYSDNTTFWVDHGIGRRLCGWIENVRLQEPSLLSSDGAVRSDIDLVLAALVNLGISEAKRLEEALAESVSN